MTALNTTHRAAFDAAAKIQKDDSITGDDESMPRKANTSPMESSNVPIVNGQTDIHYDEASARPSIKVNDNVQKV